ncbi:uncharacterized protein C8R40DRAFT_1164770 [Lentinula edodes]|uniref:uncharacterized protein n=1 Tax=Lentinula edodes TaxID=5353 RepID=UPI001E8E8013|nr:uncharacterized protein C8R40DRAFT_1164770 [Lentinula edodes]KAH7881357.1 hypothetical protein C8R40DRAFT_1164770 [Lentinula edodes]
MVLSRIILTALLALGSITVALPVVPGGGVTGTTPTPGSGARRLPRMQGDDLKPNLEAGMKGSSISPLAGEPSSPHGVPPPGSSPEVPFKKLSKQEYDEELRQKIALIKNFPNVHNNYKEIADRLSNCMEMDKKKPSIPLSAIIFHDTVNVFTLADVIQNYMKPQSGEVKNPKIEKLRKAFKEGDYPENLHSTEFMKYVVFDFGEHDE